MRSPVGEVYLDAGKVSRRGRIASVALGTVNAEPVYELYTHLLGQKVGIRVYVARRIIHSEAERAVLKRALEL
jgi:hypothetical protein